MFQKYLQSLDNYFFEGKSQIQIHSSLKENSALIKVRIVSLIYLTIVYIWTLITISNIKFNMLYFTLHGYFCTWVYFAITVEDYYAKIKFKKRIFKDVSKICSILNQFSFCSQIPITLVFWGFLFHLLLKAPTTTTNVILLNINLHMGPLVCLIFDSAYNRIEFPKKHYLFVGSYLLVYMIFNFGYSIIYEPIYPPIDWISLKSYMIVLFSFLLTFFGHYLNRLIYQKFKKKSIQQDKIQ